MTDKNKCEQKRGSQNSFQGLRVWKRGCNSDTALPRVMDQVRYLVSDGPYIK